MFDANLIRKDFPILERQVWNRPLVYLDNAATTQKPVQVLDCIEKCYREYNSNVHRGIHFLSQESTRLLEEAREKVRSFINAPGTDEIIFTRGTTESLNLLATCFSQRFLKAGDEIILSGMEHHSNIVPWQMMCERKNAVLKVLRLDEDGYLRTDTLPELVTERTKLLCVAQISNVLGIVNPVKDIINYCHSKNCAVFVDGAQGIVHAGCDVQDMDCDFYAFSGHKLYAAPGTGVLYGKKKWLEQMPPYMGGGEMIATVKFTGTTYAPLPGKYEAGTQNISGVPTLKPAIELVTSMADKELQEENKSVRDYVLNALTSDSRIRLYGVPRGTSDKIALFSFTVQGVHHEDLALILDKMGVAVRSGQMCAEPLMDRYGVTGMLRASFAPYNTMKEAEYFIESLNKAIEMLS